MASKLNNMAFVETVEHRLLDVLHINNQTVSLLSRIFSICSDHFGMSCALSIDHLASTGFPWLKLEDKKRKWYDCTQLYPLFLAHHYYLGPPG